MNPLGDDPILIDGPGDVAFEILSEPPANGAYRFGSVDDVEDREQYCSGGFHPVHLGDILSEHQRYRVIHKLGNGGFATIWLCRDAESDKLVALKILMADESRDDCADRKVLDWLETGRSEQSKAQLSDCLAIPKDHFWIDGPNGRHLCLVMPLLGPRIDSIWTKLAKPEEQLPKAALQAARGLQVLHERRICHGGMCGAFTS